MSVPNRRTYVTHRTLIKPQQNLVISRYNFKKAETIQWENPKYLQIFSSNTKRFAFDKSFVQATDVIIPQIPISRISHAY